MIDALRERWAPLDAALARWERGALISLLFVMLLAGFVQVVLRNVFNTGILGADLLLRQGLLWLGLLGASLAAGGTGRHIEIDLLSRALPAERARPARRLADGFAAVVCALLARASALFVIGEFVAGSRIAGVFPAWVFQLILPAGFALMALRFLAAGAFGRPAPPAGKTGAKS
ncbi:MAG: TRAP transporter small permease [Nitrospinota bacterium]|jgi:TRAP-type C4-dicarboxylate transport system permease small subunit|nr:TRAP transporter small permease [Nitrospinota bacterium]MDP7167015.1 TRAP transporter small permease [Nitrospinota bacterium]MDP7369112.1 TRAP transporter small permease [Nitrospinota bacterium]HJP13764.1 TRAP transporter small permease [Nitrospinota bacterium]